MTNETPGLRICVLIRRARELALTKGMIPTDLWLGPEEQKLLEEYANWIPQTYRLNSGHPWEKITETWQGMRIRKSMEPGAYAGICYTGEPL